jgi:hypothetical protein
MGASPVGKLMEESCVIPLSFSEMAYVRHDDLVFYR